MTRKVLSIIIALSISSIISVSIYCVYRKGLSDGYTYGYKVGYGDGDSSGFSVGYKQGNSSGFQQGYVEGNSSGFQQGYVGGNSSGYEFGYRKGSDIGYQSGFELGYDAGYDTGYLLGVKQGAGTGFNIRDPTYNEAVNFIRSDRTDQHQYSSTYNCHDFTRDFKMNAFDAGYRCGYVYVEFRNGAHAIVAFKTVDKGIIYCEPQTDELLVLKVGYSTFFGDTVVDFDVIW